MFRSQVIADFYSQMSKDYDILSYKKTFYQETNESTPRQQYGSRTIVRPASSYQVIVPPKAEIPFKSATGSPSQ